MRIAIGLKWPVRKNLSLEDQQERLKYAIGLISGKLVGDLDPVASIVDVPTNHLAEIKAQFVGFISDEVVVSDRKRMRP